MIDSHCHLDWDGFDGDRDAVIHRAVARGVTDVVVPAVDEASWVRVRSLAERTTQLRLHPAWGIHPVALPAMAQDGDAAVLSRLASLVADERPVAVGECGLDTTIDLGAAPLERQEAVLRGHLELARRYDLPVIFHARGPGAYARLFELLRHERLPAAGGVVHSYGGGAELLRNFLTLPLFFGFAGPATYPRARKVRASMEHVPADRLLAETDAPDQTPEPHRPGRNEPAFLGEVIEGIAAARGASAESIAGLTAANARRLFRLSSAE